MRRGRGRQRNLCFFHSFTRSTVLRFFKCVLIPFKATDSPITSMMKRFIFHLLSFLSLSLPLTPSLSHPLTPSKARSVNVKTQVRSTFQDVCSLELTGERERGGGQTDGHRDRQTEGEGTERERGEKQRGERQGEGLGSGGPP